MVGKPISINTNGTMFYEADGAPYSLPVGNLRGFWRFRQRPWPGHQYHVIQPVIQAVFAEGSSPMDWLESNSVGWEILERHTPQSYKPPVPLVKRKVDEASEGPTDHGVLSRRLLIQTPQDTSIPPLYLKIDHGSASFEPRLTSSQQVWYLETRGNFFSLLC